MTKMKKKIYSLLLGVLAFFALMLGVAFSMPTKKASAETTLSTENWTLAIEGDYEFRIQNGETYWTTGEGTYVTTASMLDKTEINGKTLSEINAENPGAITVTLQPAGGTIGSFYRVTINPDAIDMTRHDIATFVVRAGWSHTDSSGTYTINTDLYFAHRQNKASQSDQWKYIPAENVVDISDDIVLQDQGVIATNTRSILLKTTGSYWTASTPNENGGAFLNMLYVNGTSVRDWNKQAHAALDAGEITDITYGSGHGTISGNKGAYAPIFVWNAAYDEGVGGCYTQTWIPTGYISNVSSYKVSKGMGWLTDDYTKLYYVSKDVEYVKSGSSFEKVASVVDISDAFKLLVQDYTSSNGTMLYYLHTNNVKYWTQQYGTANAYAINEKEWKGVQDVTLQGGAVQMSYLEFNGTPIYDINATDNGAYGATQGNIASGSKYAPILASLTPQELGDSIKLQVPSAYPSGSGTAADNHTTITIKKGFYVVDTSTNIKYEVTKDIQWDYADGAWSEHVKQIETNVTLATMFGSASDAFAGISLEDSDYAAAPDTYAGKAKTALSYAQSANFRSHILVDDVALPQPGEAFLNVWGNYGYFTFRTGNNTATKLTILAGCQFPTYDALLNGTKEVYVTTEDVTFIKDGSGNWVKDESGAVYSVTFQVDGATYDTQEVAKDACATAPADPTKASDSTYDYTFSYWELNGAEYDFSTPVTANITLTAVFSKSLKPGEYDTSIQSVIYARDNKTNWLMIRLTEKDYPHASETYNVKTTEDQMSVLNLYDKIIVDGYTLRSRIATHGTPSSAPQINLWVADCLGIMIPGAAGALDGAKKVTIRAGAQFPSYAYITKGTEAYYVTTEEITYVNVGDANGNWERQYTATFVADGSIVETKSYVVSQGLTDLPEVPEKEGYLGAWEAYTANGNITVNAVYTKKATVLGSTGLKEMRRIDNNSNILVINPTNSDYPESVEGSWNLPLDVSHLQKFNTLDYITINGKTLREIKVSSMAINKFTRPGLGLETTLSDSMTIVIKKGCEIPSYAFQQNPNGETSAYVMDADYTCVYTAGGETAFTITTDLKHPTYEKEYILSDLFNAANTKSHVFEDGIEALTYTNGGEADYRYGYIGSTSFLLTFDFKFTGDAGFYKSFNINLGTEGYGGNKYHFGWRFYLIRGNEDAITPNMCVEYFSNTKGTDYTDAEGNSKGNNIEAISLGSRAYEAGKTYRVTIGYRLVNASTGEVEIYTAINTESTTTTYTLGGDFVTFAPYANSLTLNLSKDCAATVTVSDPDKDMSSIPTNRITLKDGNEIIQTELADSFVLPALDPVEYNKAGNVFIGWTTDTSSYPDLYPAGYEYEVSANVTLYPVWIQFSMRDGAGVRLTNGSGLRFLVDVDKAYYDAGKQLNYMTEIGTIIAPTSYLTGRELSHELGVGYYLEIPTADDKWQEGGWYSSAMLNISADQYARSFSARGYMKIAYTSGEGYIYTAYDPAEHARSIYQVANMAYVDYNEGSSERNTISDYVDAIADITIDSNLTAIKTEGANGSYAVAQSGAEITISNGSVKAVMVNGVRIMMGYDATIVIDGVSYTLSGYKLNSDGLSFTFTLEQIGDDADTSREDYYFALLQAYIDSDAYTIEHKAVIDSIANAAIDEIGGGDGWVSIVEKALDDLATIKTAAQLAANDTSKTKTALQAPVVNKGLGYTVTWSAVENADYYIVHDNNDYRPYTVVMADETLTYKAEVVGDHTITVTAHSYYEAYNSATSEGVATPKVKPVFTYKSMLDGLYKFSSSQMSTMGISTTDCYYDSADKKYFVYYNKDTGWSPYPIQATDWTSPAEFPAHAQRLKDMGNNVILLAYDTNGAYKAEDKWASSRMKYIMDTAWSMGMKVLVCDEVFYNLSMSDPDKEGAGSVEEVTAAINARDGFAEYVTHPAFYGFSLDDEPYAAQLDCMQRTITALDKACEDLGVSDPFYLACLFQADGSDERYNESELKAYYEDWLSTPGVDNKYLYVDIYTQHAMGQPTDRYNKSFNVVYGNDYLGGKYEFYQALTAHTQTTDYIVYEKQGVLLAEDMYMSLLYAAAHDVAGYSWFCYFPITGETNGCIGGYDGEGYGNGIGNGAKSDVDYYAAAKTAAYQFELIQGLLDGYDWKTRSLSGNTLKTTLSNGTNTATMYVNADVTEMKNSITVTASGSQCYLVGYGVGTADAPYQAVSGSVTLAPGQAVICMN
ncbi:MAG: InlB B-repeat-containing protein [Clostridia bacterium]|nr:InlB B-repeat-containing protein [Clostridia bacterium]